MISIKLLILIANAHGALITQNTISIIFGFAIIGLPFYSRIEQETFDGR